jgi:1,4-dihydroxy-2-naphthoate octaprenyltransferase
MALRDNVFRLLPASLCVLVALLAQVASNFANDYFDCKKGADTEARLGPLRAVASGRIPARSMLCGALVALCLACLCGLVLLFVAGWELIFVGIGIAVCVLAYSAGPCPLAYNGLGDLCVLLFYGLIPTVFTYYVQALSFSPELWFLSISTGLLSVNILVVNNYRDHDEDRRTGKRTTIVIFGRAFGRCIYIINVSVAILLALPHIIASPLWLATLYAAYTLICFTTWRQMCHTEGQSLNRTLGQTARNVLLFTILTILSLYFRQ